MNTLPLVLKTDTYKFILPPHDEDDPIYVFDMGYHHTPPTHIYGPAIRPYYLLHLIESGKGYIQRDNQRTDLSAGDAFLIRPNEITTYCSDEEDPWHYVWISFNGDFAPKLMELTTDLLCMKYQKSGLMALKNAIINEPKDTIECLNILFEVLNSIKNSKNQNCAENDIILTALQYFESNYFRHIDIGTLASQLGVSRAYFSTLFLSRTGEKPYNYLIKVRLEKAKEYLLTSNAHSMEEIAHSVGFSSLQRFSEMFKKHTGNSPLKYRKENL